MRRYIWIILFFIVLIAPFVVRQVMSRSVDPADDESTATAGLELVIVTPHNQDVRRAYSAAFDAWHRSRFGQGVRVIYLNPGGTNDIVRYIHDIYSAQGYAGGDELPPEEAIRVDIDLVWGGGDTTFERELKPFLEPVNLPAGVLDTAFPSAELNGVPLYDTKREGPPQWVGVVLSSFGLVYSPPLFNTLDLDAPDTWDDMTHPKLAGLVALADPTRSGSAAYTYMVVLQREMVDAEERFLEDHADLENIPRAERGENAEYQAAIAAGFDRGMQILTLMAANARYFTDSATQVPNDVGNGDAATGVAIDFYGRVVEQAIGSERIRFVSPVGATALNPDPIGILYGVKGQRAELANRFVEFLLTPDAQRLWNLDARHSPFLQRELRRMPIRRDVYADRTQWTDPEVNPFQANYGLRMRSEWMGLFSDLRIVWATAWIDSRTTLKEAYGRILSVEDVKRRDELIAELSRLPISLAELEAHVARRKAIEAGHDATETDPRLWMARQRLAWAHTFRQHYEDVAARAR